MTAGVKVESIKLSRAGSGIASVLMATIAVVMAAVAVVGSILVALSICAVWTEPGKDVYIYDAATGKQTRVLHHLRAVSGAALSPDGGTVAVTDFRRAVLWSTSSGKRIARLPAVLPPQCEVEFSPDGKMLAVFGYDYLSVWRVSDNRQILRDWRCGGNASFSPDSRLLACSGPGSTTVFQLSGRRTRGRRDGRVVARLRGSLGNYRTPNMGFSPDGRFLMTDSGDSVSIRRVSDWSLVARLEVPDVNYRSRQAILLLPDGKLLIADGKKVAAWDLEKRKVAYTLPVQHDAWLARNGNLLATAETKMDESANDWVLQVKIWSAGKPSLAAEWAIMQNDRLSEMIFVGDKRLCTSFYRDVIVWEVPIGRKVLEIEGRKLLAVCPRADLIAVRGWGFGDRF